MQQAIGVLNDRIHNLVSLIDATQIAFSYSIKPQILYPHGVQDSQQGYPYVGKYGLPHRSPSARAQNQHDTFYGHGQGDILPHNPARGAADRHGRSPASAIAPSALEKPRDQDDPAGDRRRDQRPEQAVLKPAQRPIVRIGESHRRAI